MGSLQGRCCNAVFASNPKTPLIGNSAGLELEPGPLPFRVSAADSLLLPALPRASCTQPAQLYIGEARYQFLIPEAQSSCRAWGPPLRQCHTFRWDKGRESKRADRSISAPQGEFRESARYPASSALSLKLTMPSTARAPCQSVAPFLLTPLCPMWHEDPTVRVF